MAVVTNLVGQPWGGSRNTKNEGLLLEAECTRLHWPMEEANEGPSCLVHCPLLITRNPSRILLPVAHGLPY